MRISAIALCLSLCMQSASGQAPATLKEVVGKRMLIGVAINRDQIFERDARALPLIMAQFNSITPDNVLKWEHVHPAPGRYDFAAADAFVAFGGKDGMTVIGHTLVWHNQTPRWVFEDSLGHAVSRETLLARMREHILTVVGRYKGRIKGWDVVNEAVVDDGSLIQSSWLKIIGDDYVAKAFEYAHEADPSAELYYNDFSMENSPKRNGAVALIKKLQAAHVPINGVGLQGHYHMDWPSAGQLDSTFSDVRALGLKALVTELDVNVLPQPDPTIGAEITKRAEYQKALDPFRQGLPDSMQQALAARYAELFTVFRKNAEVLTRITFWGVTDGDSWLNSFPVAGRTNYPLLFGRDGKPKKAFTAVINAMK